ncbi:MAG: 4-(cytidine 5'-diphospho)-2-C-methyl-D-erythritol kinase [Verrucomicrobia bacterium]|nr:4-(cytidine 5'-diphospho)-2-C-methyl-D-erythritol kinase [Verrucomicrobiota bacterium]
MSMTLERESPCKVNLLLDILGKRADGYHELESVMVPVRLCDRLEFRRQGVGVILECDHPELPTGAGNLVWRAATAFFAATGITEGVQIRLEKRIPLAAGLGGGSSNAATTLLALNDLFDRPLEAGQRLELAARLGSDVPFFLQSRPAMVRGRGEVVEPLDALPLLRGTYLVLAHPGFGVSTAWAYQQLSRFPQVLGGQRGRADRLVHRLRGQDLRAAGAAFYNSLEAPVLEKFPLLALFQESFRANGAVATLMSGSGSATFALAPDEPCAQRLMSAFRTRFGAGPWLAAAAL